MNAKKCNFFKMNKTIIFFFFLISCFITAQNTIQYVRYSDDLLHKDSITSLSILIESNSVESFAKIDFSSFQKLENLKIDFSIFHDFYNELEENSTEINIENLTLKNLNIKQLDWNFINLSNTKIDLGNSFSHLPITKLYVHEYENKITFPSFSLQLNKLEAIEVLPVFDFIVSIDIKNLNPKQIKSLNLGDFELNKKSQKTLYKFSNLNELILQSNNSLNCSKFKKLKNLEINVSSMSQLRNCLGLKFLKKLSIISSSNFKETLHLNGFEKLAVLEFLAIKNTSIEIEELCNLSENLNLKEIYLEDYYQINDILPCKEWFKKINFKNN